MNLPEKKHRQRDCPFGSFCPECAPLWYAMQDAQKEAARQQVESMALAARAAYYAAIDGRSRASEWPTLSEDERRAWRAVAATIADIVRDADPCL